MMTKSDSLYIIKRRYSIVAMVMILILSACGASTSAATKAVLTSPQPNAEFLSSVPVQIQGQADGAGIVRVDVIVDSAVLQAVAASDITNGVASLPVSVQYTTQNIGTHFVQLKVYAASDKLIAVSDPQIFTIKLAPVTPTTAPLPTPMPTLAPAPTAAAPLTSTTTTTATGELAPSLTITNEFANIRSGPGINFDLVGKLLMNDKAPVRGKSPDGVWWQIAFDKGPNGVGWVRGDLVSPNAAAKAIGTVTAPPSPTSPPPAAAQPTVPPATAVGTPVAVVPPTPSGPLCDATVADWRGANPNYPFCAKQDPVWADPAGEWNVYDNGKDIKLSISWYIYGSNIKQMWIHFVQDNTLCGFARPTQHTVNQQVSPAGKYDFNVLDFPYGGTLKVSWTEIL
ncbi:MAG TPA: SH3 domain-containing protein, partial [Anaerolineae bacterium]